MAVRAAADLSSRAGAELHIVHVRQKLPISPGLPQSAYFERAFEEYADLYREETEQLMRQQAFKAKAEGADVAGAHLREGEAAEEITGLAGELGADLVVVGSRGAGMVERLVTGSVSEGVVRLASCPVLVMRGEEAAWPPKRLVIGDDSSEAARGAGELAVSIGKLFDAQALLVRVYEPMTIFKARRASNVRMAMELLRKGEEFLEKRADELEEVLGARTEIRIATGDPAAIIREAAEEEGEAALVVVGSRGLGKLERLRMWSISNKVMRAASGPVLVYRQPLKKRRRPVVRIPSRRRRKLHGPFAEG